MGVDLGSAYGKVVIDASGVRAGTRDAVNSLNGLRSGFASAATSVAALGAALTGASALSVRASASLQGAFAGVAKTTEGLTTATGQLTEVGAALKAEFIAMGAEVPKSIEELMAIGELGGQLGIARDALDEFTESIAALDVSTNLAAEEGAAALARMANVFEISGDQMGENTERLGSAIVDLGNNFATTERDIVAFAERIAGAGRIAGLTQADVLGIGAALSSVGVEAEAGGTAVQKVLLGMNQAVVEAGDKLAVFAQTAGLTVQEFADLWEQDAAAAFTLFVEGLGDAGDDAINILSDLELEDQRLIRAFLSLSNAGDLLSRALETGNQAFEDNTALAKEAGQRYATLESEFATTANVARATAAAFGDALAPAVSDVLGVVRDVMQAFQELPPPLQETVAEMVALAGGVATLGGGLGIAVPRIKGAVAGISELVGVSSAATLGIGALAAGAAALIIHLNNVEAAHEDEARSIFDASETYADYVARLEDAGRGSYTLSEALYEVAKSAGEAGDAIDAIELQKAQTEYGHLFEEVFRLADEWERNTQGMETNVTKAEILRERVKELVAGMSDLELIAAGDADMLIQLGQQYGMTATEAAGFSDMVRELIDSQQDYREVVRLARIATDDHVTEILAARDATTALTGAVGESAAEIDRMKGAGIYAADAVRLTADEMAILGEETGLTAQEIGILSTQLGMGADAIRDYAEALGDARGRLAGFFGAISSGINDLSDIDQQIADASVNYQEALRDIQSQAAESLGDVKTKFADSLPDPTTVAERMQMTADAWDEFALRLADVGNLGTGSPWYDDVMTALADTEFAFDASKESVADWAARVRDAFYAGDLKGLINENAAAWQEHKTAVDAAMTEETGIIQSRAAEQSAALKAEYERQQAELEAALNEKRIAIALAAAEASGELQQWSEATFGPDLAGAFDQASEVLDGLKSGLIPLEGDLAGMLDTILSGLDDVRAEAQDIAAENETTMQELASGTWMSEAEEGLAGLQEKLDKALDLQDLVPEAATAAQDLADEIGAIDDDIPDDPMRPYFDAIEAVHDYLGEAPISGPMAEEAKTFNSAIDDIVAKIGEIPDLNETEIREKGGQGVIDMAVEVKDALEAIPTDINISIHGEYEGEGGAEWTPTIALAHALDDLVDFVETSFPLDLAVDIPDDADVFSDFVGVLNDMLEAMQALASFTGVGDLQSFESALVAVLDMIERVQRSISTVVLKGQGTPTVGELAGWLNDAARAMQAVLETGALQPGQADQFFEDLSEMLHGLVALAEEFALANSDLGGVVLPSTALVDRITAILAPVGELADSLARLREHSALDAASIGAFIDNAEAVIDGLLDLVARIGDAELSGAVKLGVLLGTIGESVGDAAEGMAAVAEYPAGDISAQLRSLVRHVVEAAILFQMAASVMNTEALEAAREFATAASGIVTAIARAAEALEDIAGYAGTDDLVSSARRLGYDVATAAEAIRQGFVMAGLTDAEALEAAAEWSRSAGRIIGIIGGAVRNLEALGDYGGLAVDALAQFEADIPLVVDAMLRIADQYENEGVAAAAEFSDSVGVIGRAVGEAVGGLVAVGDFGGVPAAQLARFEEDTTALLQSLATMLGGLSGTELGDLTALGEALQALGDGVLAVMDAMFGISGYEGGIGAGLEALLDDLYLLVDAFQALQDAIPPELIPSSPPPLAAGLRDVAAAMRAVELASMASIYPAAMGGTLPAARAAVSNRTLNNYYNVPATDPQAMADYITQKQRNEMRY